MSFSCVIYPLNLYHLLGINFSQNSGIIRNSENNTIVENSSNINGGGISVFTGTVTARNNIIRGNIQAQGGQVVGAINITYSNIEGGFSGKGNIDVDPLFLDDNYNLSENSPCIDAGDPNSPLDPDGTRADMGAKMFYHLDAPYIRILDFLLDDSQGNSNGKADANETVNLIVGLINSSLNGTGISATLTSNDPDIQVIQCSADYGELARDQSSANETNPFTFSVSSDAVPHYTNFYLNITADGGYVNNDSLEILVGSATTLIVDDDGGDLYEQYYTEPLENLQVFPAVWDVFAEGCPSEEELCQYKRVIWFTGDDRNSTLTTEELVNRWFFKQRRPTSN